MSWMRSGMVTATMLVAAAGCGDHDQDECAPGAICTIAGQGESGFDGDGGPAREARLYLPLDMAGAPDGELWVIDFNNFRVRAIDRDGVIRTVLGSGELGDGPTPAGGEVPALEASLNHIGDILFHDGYLYIAAWHNSRVKRLDLDRMTLENYAGRGVRAYDGDDGPALDADLDLPSGLAIDADGDLLIMDQQNQVIRAVDERGIIRRVAGRCIVEPYDSSGCDGEPFVCPNSDKLACGEPDACAAPCSPAFAGDGGDALELRMGQPFGAAVWPSGHLAIDSGGGLLFADSNNHRIRRIGPDGIVTTVAGTGEPGHGGDGGPATEAQLSNPTDLEIAPDGSILFTDTYAHCVRAIDPAGIIATVAGTCGERGFAGDGGPATEALLKLPTGVELIGDRLYIADSGNHRIRLLTL